MTEYKVTFLPTNQVAFARKGERVLDVALRAEINLEHVCGGSCSCATCHVIIKEGFEALENPSEDELDKLQELGKQLSLKSRLACQTEVHADLVVEIPN